MNITLTSAAYAVLRQAGASPQRARAQLSLAPSTAVALERAFRLRRWTGPWVQRPRLARPEAHVRAVLAQGGFPVLPEPPR